MSSFAPIAEPVVAPAQGRSVAAWSVTEAPSRTDFDPVWREAPFDPVQAIHERFEAQAAQTPDAIALIFVGATAQAAAVQQITYGELNRRANQLAHHLRTLGVGSDRQPPSDSGLPAESLVGLCMERSPEMVIGILGILKAGAAYVPLDPTYPRDRLTYLMKDADVNVLVTQSTLLPLLTIDQQQVVCLDQVQTALAQMSAANPQVAVRPDQLAYVIYTSGSTGQPKGVMIEHRQLVYSIDTRCAYYQEPMQRCLFLSSVAFDSTVAGLFWTLCQGGGIVLCQEPVQRNVVQLTQVIASQQVSHLIALPTFYRVILEHIQTNLPALRLVVVAGESCSPELTKTHNALLPHVKLFNEYGPTEATIWSTVYPVPAQEQATLVPIGQAIPNTQLYLLDEQQQPAAPGEPGEIYISSAGVARGYLNRPDITAARFLTDPFSGRPDARMYRTGDIARYRADGLLEFLGRVDQQVKIRGFRVELEEIEAVLTQHPHVKAAVVVAKEVAGGDKRLVAYLVPKQNSKIAADQIRGFLKNKLPSYMLPARLLPLTELPITPNGKVDRLALLASFPDDLAVRGYVAPRSPLEQRLAELWQQVLKLDKIGVFDEFFELGGNSMQAMVLAGKIQNFLAEPFYLISILESSTIARLAAHLHEHYPAAVAQALATVGEQNGEVYARPIVTQAVARIDAAKVAKMRRLMTDFFPPLAPVAPTRPPNPPAIFVLASPRSGTTLTRVMLAGHPQLFAPQELELLAFDTLQARQTFYAGQESLYTEGLVRAVMALQACSAEEAKALIDGYARQGISTLDFYRILQGWVGERRLVDKTSAYTFNPNILRQAERGFAEPFYIHLVRHPAAMINSFAEIRLDQVFFRCEHGFAVKELAELIWLVNQQNILAFLQEVPAARQCRIRFEDLVAQPQRVMEAVCNRLNLAFHPAMIAPYADQKSRMTDGIHAESRAQGDPKFHQHRQIEAATANRWQAQADAHQLGDITWEVAHALGY